MEESSPQENIAIEESSPLIEEEVLTTTSVEVAVDELTSNAITATTPMNEETKSNDAIVTSEDITTSVAPAPTTTPDIESNIVATGTGNNNDQTVAASLKLPAPTISFEDNASWIGKAFVYYLDPLFVTGYKRPLQHEDLGLVANQDKASILFKNFVVAWDKEIKLPTEKRSLWNVLFRTVGWMRLFNGLALYAAYSAVSFGPIMILNALTKHLQGTAILPQSILWLFVSLMFALPMLGSIFASQSNNIMAHIGLQFRNVLITMIYRKALRLSPAARQSSSTGQIVTMFSSDTAQLQRFLFFVNNVALAPATIAVSLALIYQQVGPATFVGLALMIILMPISGFIFGMLNTVRQKKVKVTDRRVKLMNEVLSGIRIIKFYAWERAFEKKISEIREEELILLKHLAYIVAFGFSVILVATPILQPVVIFFTYASLGNQLDAAKAFTTISLFNLLQLPFTFLPLGLAQYSQSLVSSKRMLDFFVAEELEPYIETEAADANDDTVIKMSDANLGWITEDQVAKQAEDQAKEKEKSDAKKAAAAGRTKTVVDTKEKATEKGYEMVPISAGAEEAAVDVEVAPAAAAVNRSVYTLTSMNLNVKQGQLVAVVGSVGSGKSSFLSALLGEMHRQSGSVRVIGSVAYCDQRPWIINSTVKENILFGLPEVEDRMDLAIHTCNLEDDIHVLPGGILTEIGERGINLSGGQKARVALARAVYRNADVYLLDDPLSAVDAHVGQHLFEECIQEGLKGKTRILVTHHVHVLSQCDHVVVLQEGRILAQGTYDEIIATGVDFEALIPPKADGSSAAASPTAGPSKSPSLTNLAHVDAAASTTAATVHKSPVEQNKFSLVRANSAQAMSLAKRRKEDERSKKIISVEERNMGDVAAEAYTYYIKAGGWMLFVLILILSAANQGIGIVANFWLAFWGQVSVREESRGSPLTTSENLYYLNFFALFSCLSLIIFVMRSILLANHRLGTSIKLHKLCLSHVLGATVAFFDITPLGRILNRFSSDMATLDEELSQSIGQVLNSLTSCLGSVAAIAGATKGVFLILFVPVAISYERITKYFRKTNTAVARLESISRSPIYADFNQALTGLNTIRAYRDEKRFVDSLEARLDRNSIAAITQQIAGQWLAIRLDLVGSLITFFIALLTIASSGFIPAGFMALGLSYSFQLTQFLKFAVRMLAGLEAQFNSVERIMHYTNSIEQDGGPNENAALVPKEWPTNGEITGTNLQMRYRDGPLVLTGLDFHVNKSEKVGIAGRTGSGKSSLMIALFRIQELSAGSIFIDGVDLSVVPLPILRSKLGIIPQDPVMFSATVRFNLDPFDQKTDTEIWTVLESVAMKSHILSLPGQLLEVVAEGGDNFSAGQRQLICIARALLRKPKILILDEATASIDNETDALIQTMVRQEFKESTVLTIAHRLHTIIDCDKIMVLDAGKLAEMDSPEALLQKEDGLFKALWDRHKSSHQQQPSSAASSNNLTALL